MKKIIITLALILVCSSSSANENVFTTLDGQTINYEKLLSSSKTVFFFWTTWCPTCVREMQYINSVYTDFSKVNIIYINGGQNSNQVRRFVESKSINQDIQKKIILDGNLLLAKKFSVFAIPTFIFFKNGEVIYRSHYLNQDLLAEIFDQ